VNNFFPPELHSSGNTPIGEAIESGFQMLRRRKMRIKAARVHTFVRGYFSLRTGGDDSWKRAAELVRIGEDKRNSCSTAVGVEGAHMDIQPKSPSERR